MQRLTYDPEADAIYVNISSRTASYTLEFNDDINIDMSDSKKIVGVEVLSASRVISELFQKKITKDEIKNFLTCTVRGKETLYVDFELGEREKLHAAMVLPQPLRSPIANA